MFTSNNTQRVLFNSITYIGSGLLLRCFSFFLLPLYTAYLTREDYGIQSLATSFVTTASYVVAFSLFSAVMRFYVDLKDDPEKLKRFYGTISASVFLFSIGFGILFTVFRNAVSRYLFAGTSYYPIIFVCLISLVFHCQQKIFDNILRSQQKAKKSSTLSISFFLVTTVFTILFICVARLGALGVILASCLSYICYTLYFTVQMLKAGQICYCLDIRLLKKALKYSIPIMPHNLSTHIAMLVSTVLIGDVVSLGSLGLYSVANKFGHLADTIQNYVSKAYGPWFYQVMHDDDVDVKKKVRTTVQLLTACIGAFFLVLALFSHDCIVLFVNNNYVEAWKFVPAIVFVYTIKTMYYFYVDILFYFKKASRYLFTATLSSSILNVFLTFFMVPLWGVFGSLAADAIAMVIRVGIVVMISKRFVDVGLKIKDFVINFSTIVFFMAAGLSLSYLRYSHAFNIYNFLFKIVVVLLYIYFAVFYRHKERVGLLLSTVKTKLRMKIGVK